MIMPGNPESYPSKIIKFRTPDYTSSNVDLFGENISPYDAVELIVSRLGPTKLSTNLDEWTKALYEFKQSLTGSAQLLLSGLEFDTSDPENPKNEIINNQLEEIIEKSRSEAGYVLQGQFQTSASWQSKISEKHADLSIGYSFELSKAAVFLRRRLEVERKNNY